MQIDSDELFEPLPLAVSAVIYRKFSAANRPASGTPGHNISFEIMSIRNTIIASQVGSSVVLLGPGISERHFRRLIVRFEEYQRRPRLA
jgi:hypothetical protein